MALRRELEVAVEAARAAGRVLLEKRLVPGVDTAGLAVLRKGERDYVTEVDRASEAVVIGIVRAAFPKDAILAEESAGVDKSGIRRGGPRPRAGKGGSRRWYIDPLDGTVNYVHGFPMFCVSIGLEVADPTRRTGGRLEVGVIFDPVHEEMFTAARGGGAFLNGRRIQVGGRANLGDCLVTTGFPYRIKPRLDRYLESFRRIFLEVGGIRRAGAACLDLAYTACGRADGFWEFGLSPWDIAAGALLVREAGGVVTDFDGGDGFLLRGDVVAGAPAVHQAMLRVVRQTFA